MRIFGVWYSHNQPDREILMASLNAIDRAAQTAMRAGHTMIVRTCTWHAIVGNPFPWLQAKFHLPNHLGIVMQILRPIYEWQTMENGSGKDPDVLCLLEHDVLYPDDYFVRVAEALAWHPEATGVINLNYIGLRPKGFVRVNQRDVCFSQMSFRWAQGIAHVEMLLRECVRNGWRVVEPDDQRAFARLEYDESLAPVVHINSDRHFSSHHQCYAQEPFCTDHPYWGSHRKYYPERLLA